MGAAAPVGAAEASEAEASAPRPTSSPKRRRNRTRRLRPTKSGTMSRLASAGKPPQTKKPPTATSTATFWADGIRINSTPPPPTTTNGVKRRGCSKARAPKRRPILPKTGANRARPGNNGSFLPASAIPPSARPLLRSTKRTSRPTWRARMSGCSGRSWACTPTSPAGKSPPAPRQTEAKSGRFRESAARPSAQTTTRKRALPTPLSARRTRTPTRASCWRFYRRRRSSAAGAGGAAA